MKLNNVTERDIEVRILEKLIMACGWMLIYLAWGLFFTWKPGFIHFVRFWKLVVRVLVVFFSVLLRFTEGTFWRFRLGWRKFRTFGNGKLSAFLNVRRTLKVNVEIKLPYGMLKTTQENKRSVSCTRESGLLKKTTEGQLTVSFSLIPPLIFANVLCNPWDVNYPAPHLSKWANLAPAAGSIFILYLFIKISFIPHPAFTLLLHQVKPVLDPGNYVCFAPYGLRYSSALFFIFLCNSKSSISLQFKIQNLELVRTWQIDFNVKWTISRI